VGFATNSHRHLEVNSDYDDVRVMNISRAVKPLLTRRLRGLPRPVILVGGQIATDGLLAWRLGFNFAHVQQISQLRPWGPRLMHQLGRPLTPRLFHQHPDKS
jgi:predicted HAD superfamily phosphohydrolase YqeG